MDIHVVLPSTVVRSNTILPRASTHELRAPMGACQGQYGIRVYGRSQLKDQNLRVDGCTKEVLELFDHLCASTHLQI